MTKSQGRQRAKNANYYKAYKERLTLRKARRAAAGKRRSDRRKAANPALATRAARLSRQAKNRSVRKAQERAALKRS